MVKVKLLLLCLCYAAVWTQFVRACYVGKCLINITRTKRRLLASMSEMKRFIARIMLQSFPVIFIACLHLELSYCYEAICNLWLNRKNTNCLMRFNFVSLINSSSCCFEFSRQQSGSTCTIQQTNGVVRRWWKMKWNYMRKKRLIFVFHRSRYAWRK